jgi:hypothetical protein
MSTKPRGDLPSLLSENFCRQAAYKRVTTFLTRASNQGCTAQSACECRPCQASGDLETTCLPSRLSWVRVPSPAPAWTLSLWRPIPRPLGPTWRRGGKQEGGALLCETAYNDILPSRRHDIPPRVGDSLPLLVCTHWLPTTVKRGFSISHDPALALTVANLKLHPFFALSLSRIHCRRPPPSPPTWACI